VTKCAAFYREAFGFMIVPGDDPPKDWIELETGGCRLAFHQAHGSKGPIHPPTGGPMNPHKIVFYAKDVPKTRAKLVAKGVKMRAIQTYGKLRFCDGRDPEGHVFQISNRR
jgi:uncharacterized glyoxalase superfamily protein PhnB